MSATFWFFKLVFISSNVHSESSELFTTPLDEFKNWGEGGLNFYVVKFPILEFLPLVFFFFFYFN